MKELWSIRAQTATFKIALIVMGVVTVIAVISALYFGNEMQKESSKRIYVLRNNNKLVEATATDLNNSYSIMARGAVENVNKFIFQQIPDPSEINRNIKKAEAVGDRSVSNMISALKTNRFYNNIVSQNYFTVLITDSINIDYSKSVQPYTYYGKLKIIKDGEIYWRKLVTIGKLEYTNVRTNTDKMGFLVEDVKTIQFETIK